MSIVAWPGVSPRNLEWSQPPVEQVNRSIWTGRTRIVQLGGAARWTATGEMPPMFAPKMVLWRGFVFALRGRANTFRLVAVEADQHPYSATVRVDDAFAPGAFTLPLKGLPASTLVLKAGSMITVPLPSGDEQLIGLIADLGSTSGGQSTAQLATPLRETPAGNAVVETKRPWGLMRSPTGAKWAVEPGAVYSHGFSAEEAY